MSDENGTEKPTEITTGNHITFRIEHSWAATRYCLKRSLAKERRVIESLSHEELVVNRVGIKFRTYELASFMDAKILENFLAFLKSQEIPYRIT